jgi:competence ComEA-like helix-hairpin-helix protein
MANSCSFTTDTLRATVADPRKRVRYFTGLVLGPEEFQADQRYFMARDERHQRALHGYGVVSGLAVTPRADPDTGAPQVVVAPGQAVTPRGASVCVPLAQCADLNLWLEGHRDDLLGSPPTLLPDTATLYLVLCARECDTDAVPVLGDPCRTLEDATAASRIADDFELCLWLAPPQQREEQAVQALGAWLRSIDIDAGADADALTPEELAAALREHLLAGALAEPGEPAPGDSSPPLALRLHPEDAAAALALAYRIWINEVRPALAAEAGPCAPPADGDDGQCVLLACIEVPYAEGADGRLVVTGDIVIDTACAPLLVQTRVLQELLLGGPCCTGGALLPAAGGSPPMGDGAGGSPPAGGALGPPAHAELLDLDADDHPQYLLVDPATRALTANLAADGNLIVDLGEPAAPSGAEAVRWDRAVKNADPVPGGDLAGNYPAPAVAALQGNPVAPGALGPAEAGRVLLWDGTAWQAGQLPLEAGLVRIIRLSWRHGRATRLALRHDGNPVNGLAIGFGTAAGQPAAVRRGTLNDRVLRVFLRQEASLGTVPIWWIAELRPAAVLPVRVVQPADPTGLIEATETPAADAEVDGVLFQLDEAAAQSLLDDNQRLFIELAGDHVLAADGRAIDAEYPGADLPSGDRPGGARLGTRGGRFESWVTAGRLFIPIGGIEINGASVAELMQLPGIGDQLAARIVERRERLGAFASVEELAGVQGVTAPVLNRLRALLDN